MIPGTLRAFGTWAICMSIESMMSNCFDTVSQPGDEH
jgi:hypothetical protein